VPFVTGIMKDAEHPVLHACLTRSGNFCLARITILS
jgi:hypothetical protein